MRPVLAKVFTALTLSFTFGVSALHASSEGVSPAAYEIVRFANLPVTNAMIMSWIVSAILIISIRCMVLRPTLVPSRGQAIIESLLTGIRDLIAPIVGKKLVEPTLPLFVGLFTYILIQNWSGLLPGVGTIGHFHDGHFKYFFRPANADLNGTIALSLVAMIAWLYFVLKYAGFKTLFTDLFGNKANKAEVPAAIYYLLFVVFIAVGFIEIVSILFRPVSLSLRLYGNIFGGENLLTSMTGLVRWIVPVPFYFLEVLVGFVQALVFTLLLAVYIGSICNHHDDSEAPGGAQGSH
ncbi:MAG: ATP synthase F0 subunit A [Verrucomicrobia bacterium 21-51-4]|nr:MAG: ATP synthase F0 subunit A [Verrucomicrobia bacterium 21-51-4]HQU08694.1 F0F1 ATP synthase subunit A [Opitutales bacterium]